MKYLLLVLLLAGCGTKPIEIVTTQKEVPVIIPTKPRPMILNDIQWKVLTEANKPTMIVDEALICLSPEFYQSLAGNMTEIIRYLNQQQEIIRYYEAISTK